jgi:Fic family protein
MLYTTPPISNAQAERLRRLDQLRTRLHDEVSAQGPWLGSLRREVKASSIESSISIEGFDVDHEDAVAIAAGEDQGSSDDDNRKAAACYAQAMNHVGTMAIDPVFRWLDRVILDLHFDACYFQRDKDPGRWRTGSISVTSPPGPPAYVGPPGEEVIDLMGEVVDWLESGDLNAPPVVRAAMAHLHVVSVHPFRDGNGRLARIVQSLVLARERILSPELGSIEDYLARNTPDYYEVLREVQGGSYQPDRDAAPWVEFCIDAHLEQAERRLEQVEEAGHRWGALEAVAEERRWPERLVIAMEHALTGGVERGRYSGEAGIALPTATGDLRRLADAGLVRKEGGGRSTRYVASDDLRERVQR